VGKIVNPTFAGLDVLRDDLAGAVAKLKEATFRSGLVILSQQAS
jgi:hypothetical protein